MTLLSIENLSLSFGQNTVVDKVSLTINKGEMLAVVGESGSGKSLTALSCLGLQPPGANISGKIIFDNTPLLDVIPGLTRDPGQHGKSPKIPAQGGDDKWKKIRGKKISMIFQEPMTALNPLHTIGKQISESCGSRSESTGSRAKDPVQPLDAAHRIKQLLDSVGLSHMKDRLDAYPHQLSGGERQRVMIAMAIANSPDLLIADEPTTAVDVTIQKRILELLKKLQGELGMAILFITHDLTIVRKMADRVAVMKNGIIVEQGPVAEVFGNPKQPYTKLLLGSEPKGSPAPAASNEPLIGCKDLNVWFPIKKGVFRRTAGYVKAVKDASITIPKGSTLGVVGESGSGKTTLGFALLRMLASKGEITFADEAGETLRLDQLSGGSMQKLRRQMQPVFQDPYSSLNPRMSIHQIIDEGLRVHFGKLSAEERNHMVDEALVEVGLTPDIRSRYPHEFSGGQRQRISIARSVVLKPRFMVLDEPTSALDLTIQTQIVELLKNLQQKHGLSYMFISHDLRVVRAISHHIVVMRAGEIIEHAPTPELFANPKNDYTKSLIDAAFLK